MIEQVATKIEININHLQVRILPTQLKLGIMIALVVLLTLILAYVRIEQVSIKPVDANEYRIRSGYLWRLGKWT